MCAFYKSPVAAESLAATEELFRFMKACLAYGATGQEVVPLLFIRNALLFY